MTEESAQRSTYKTLLAYGKYVVAFAILYLVVNQADTDSLKHYASTINPLYLILAFIFFTIGQIASTFRMGAYYAHIGKPIDFKYNIILYYVGLFYNIIFPGGIGGDGYKIYLLNKQANYPIKEGIKIQLATRTNGLLVLLLSIYATICFIPLPFNSTLIVGAAIGLSIVTIISYMFLSRRLFGMENKMEWRALPYSFLVQGMNILCMASLWWGLSDGKFLAEYILLFQVAAIAGMIPITIGGLGIREFTFFYGAGVISLFTGYAIDGELGIVISLLVFAITLVSAVFGLIWLHPISRMHPCQSTR